jgi:hypothetical protein
MSVNDITGDRLRSRGYSPQGEDNFDFIFKKGKYATKAEAVQPEPQGVGRDTAQRALSRHSDSAYFIEQGKNRDLSQRPKD